MSCFVYNNELVKKICFFFFLYRFYVGEESLIGQIFDLLYAIISFISIILIYYILLLYTQFLSI